jgi:hypothetical protein
VQDYVEPARLTVISPAANGEGSAREGFAEREMFLTLGLGVVLGRYQGVLARISPSRITNVAREGFVQAAFGAELPRVDDQ